MCIEGIVDSKVVSQKFILGFYFMKNTLNFPSGECLPYYLTLKAYITAIASSRRLKASVTVTFLVMLVVLESLSIPEVESYI